MLYEYLIGKTLILDDGTEDVLRGYDAATQEFFSDTRRWDTRGNELLTGDPAQAALCAKKTFVWTIQFVGYGFDRGAFTPLVLQVADQRLAARLARDYNARVHGMEPEGDLSFLRCGYRAEPVDHDPSWVGDDAEARAILESGVILDRAWRREAEPSPRP